jgi:hypoxanthine phosphoribosyltransferase
MIYEMLLGLAQRIRKSDYSPEVIVGVSRGGWPPARIMSDLLENPNLANMKVTFYKDIGVRYRRPMITQPVTSDVVGKRVLVVDDIADTGLSLRAVIKHLRKKGAEASRVCTIYVKPHSIYVPDFFAKRTSKWVIFPWERLEALRLISKKIVAKNGGISNVKEQLKNTGMSARLIRELLTINFDP